MNTVKITTAGLICEEFQFLPTLMVLKSILDNRLKKKKTQRRKSRNFKIFWVSQNKDILTTVTVPLNVYSPVA